MVEGKHPLNVLPLYRVTYGVVRCAILPLFMHQTPTITIPLSTAEKLTQIGQAMLSLAEEMKQHAKATKGTNPPIVFPDLIPPTVIPKGDEWFWSEEWQKGEREVNKAYREGRYKMFDTVDELIADLDRSV
jgi:hypothetical protein